jgi:hypothetical protein
MGVSIEAPLLGNMKRCSFLRAFGIQRFIKRFVIMLCKGAYLSIETLLRNLEGIQLLGLFERKGKYIWVPSWTQRTLRLLSLGAIWKFGKGTELS